MSKLRIGVLGAGRGRTYAHLFQTFSEAQTVAWCDKDQPRLEAAANQLNNPNLKLFASYEEMLQQTDVEAVVVASDGTLHSEHTCMALEAGKHVLSEVPMDYTLEGCKKIVQTVEKTKLVYMMVENSNYLRYMPTIKGYINQGKLGEMVYSEAEYVHDVRKLYYRDETGRYYSYQEAKNNPKAKRAWRSGIHPIQYITHSLGPLLWLLDDRCATVSCLSTGSHTSPEDGNPDAEVAIFKTDKGRVIKILCAHTIAHPGNSWYTLFGSKGSVETPRGSAQKPVVYFEGEGEAHRWKTLEWDEFNTPIPEEAQKSGHGGSDWFIARTFADILVHGTPNPIDCYRAADYTVPGICAAKSAEQGGTLLNIPDLRTLGN